MAFILTWRGEHVTSRHKNEITQLLHGLHGGAQLLVRRQQFGLQVRSQGNEERVVEGYPPLHPQLKRLRYELPAFSHPTSVLNEFSSS